MSRYVLILIVLLLAGCGGAGEGESPVEAERSPEVTEETGVTVEAVVSPTLRPSATATEIAPAEAPTQAAEPTITRAARETKPAAPALPPVCVKEGEAQFPYVNYTAAYCLQVPASFQIGDVFPEGAPNVENILGIYGPSYDSSLEPLRAGLNIVVVGHAEGRTLDEVVEETVIRSVSDVSKESAELGGEPAVILHGLSGRTQHRTLFTIHEGKVYRLTVYPTGDDFPVVAGDVELVWETVLDSFTFLSPDILERFAPCPQQASPYVDVTAGYCLRYPSEFTVVQTTNPPAVTFADTLLSFDGDQESVRVALSTEMEEVAEDRTLQQLVDEMAAGYAVAEIEQRPAELGGEAAIIIEGLFEGAGSRQLLALHGGAVYRLTLSSVGDELPEAAAAAERLWEAATGSFVFLPPAD